MGHINIDELLSGISLLDLEKAFGECEDELKRVKNLLRVAANDLQRKKTHINKIKELLLSLYESYKYLKSEALIINVQEYRKIRNLIFENERNQSRLIKEIATLTQRGEDLSVEYKILTDGYNKIKKEIEGRGKIIPLYDDRRSEGKIS